MAVKEYFKVNVSQYVSGKDYDVLRPASLNHPKDHAVMFVTTPFLDRSDALLTCRNCLVFWPETAQIPAEIKERHAVYPCVEPHGEYCRFYVTNHITYLPEIDEYEMVNGAFIANSAVIGQNCTIFPGAYIGGEVTMGDNVYIGSGTRLVGEVHIGNNVVIRENTVIGADGLSTDRDDSGKAMTMPQFGCVVIEDDVQIGALTVIARGAIDSTLIKRGSKIDNSTFISHNVVVGEDTFVVGETIMFGSSSTGQQAFISGNSTIRDGRHIGDKAVVGMGSVVVNHVEAGCVVKGNPAK